MVARRFAVGEVPTLGSWVCIAKKGTRKAVDKAAQEAPAFVTSISVDAGICSVVYPNELVLRGFVKGSAIKTLERVELSTLRKVTSSDIPALEKKLLEALKLLRCQQHSAQRSMSLEPDAKGFESAKNLTLALPAVEIAAAGCDAPAEDDDDAERSRWVHEMTMDPDAEMEPALVPLDAKVSNAEAEASLVAPSVVDLKKEVVRPARGEVGGTHDAPQATTINKRQSYGSSTQSLEGLSRNRSESPHLGAKVQQTASGYASELPQTPPRKKLRVRALNAPTPDLPLQVPEAVVLLHQALVSDTPSIKEVSVQAPRPCRKGKEQRHSSAEKIPVEAPVGEPPRKHQKCLSSMPISEEVPVEVARHVCVTPPRKQQVALSSEPVTELGPDRLRLFTAAISSSFRGQDESPARISKPALCARLAGEFSSNEIGVGIKQLDEGNKLMVFDDMIFRV